MSLQERLPTLEPHDIFTITVKFDTVDGKPRLAAELEWDDLYKLEGGGVACDSAITFAAFEVIDKALTKLASGAMSESTKESMK